MPTEYKSKHPSADPIVKAALQSMRTNGDLASVMVLADILSDSGNVYPAHQEAIRNAIQDAVQGLWVDLGGILHHELDQEDKRREDFSRARKLMDRHYQRHLDAMYKEGCDLIDSGEIPNRDNLIDWTWERTEQSRWMSVTYLQSALLYVSDSVDEVYEELGITDGPDKVYLCHRILQRDLENKFSNVINRWDEED